MPWSLETKKQVLNRIRPIQGQLSALEQSLASGADCGPVLQKLAVIRGAVNGLMMPILATYLQEQFMPDERSCNQQGKSFEKTISIMRSYLR